MGKVSSKGYKFFICFFTGLLWGVIIGAIGISTVVSYRIDSFYEKIAYLENTIVDKDEKLDKLEKSINQSNIILKDIVVYMDFSSFSKEQVDQIDSIYIEKTIKEKFRTLLGKEVNNLDAEMLMQVVDKRILKLDSAEYQLTVSKLVLSDVLKLWVKVSVMEIES